MKKAVLIFVLAISLTRIQAQEYRNSIGLRGGPWWGVTFKHFKAQETALEGILSTHWKGFSFTGLYEKQAPAFDVPHLYWYYGGGGHVGYWGNYYDGHPWLKSGETTTVLGVDGIVGLEYNIADIPLSFSLDWKPALNIVGPQTFWPNDLALSIRFRLN